MTQSHVLSLLRFASVAAAFWFSASGILAAQAPETTMTWSDELCENTIHFDPKRYDETEVRNTIHLLFGPEDIKTPMVGLPIQMRDVAKLLDGLSKDCSNALGLAKSLKFLPLQGIEDYRNSLISEVEDWCRYGDVKLRGLWDPSALREYTRAPKACLRFVEAMEGKTNLAAVFRDTVEENCRSHVSPALCVQREFAEAHRAAGDEGMRLYLTTYAWTNCTVPHTLGNATAVPMGRLRENLEEQFRRTFRVTQDHCEAPVDSHPELGPLATFETDAAPATPATQWNIVALGLFCGSDQIYPGQIVAYVYGIDDQRLRSGEPLAAILNVDGKTTDLVFHPYQDLALSPVDAGVVRDLLKARNASIRILKYNSPNPERLKLDNAESEISSALAGCFKP
jgi:hypothetical protein